MLVLVTYDVSTTTPAGRRRLNKVAKICLDFGHRVQNSVFECEVDSEHFTRLKLRLIDTFHPEQDSLRFYFLGSSKRHRCEHLGLRPSIDPLGPLIA